VRGRIFFYLLFFSLVSIVQVQSGHTADGTTTVRGNVVDAETGKPLPCRLYIQSDSGTWHFAKSASSAGSAVEYSRRRGERSVEIHTTLSAHPFTAELPPGNYTVTAERGKEYFTSTQQLSVGEKPAEFTLQLKRWIDLSKRGWYSGDTHVHRKIEELPNAILAEDLNVALPLTYWVTVTDVPPTKGRKSSDQSIPAKLIKVDDQHVIYPLNTEYEIFSVGAKRHTLGAVFVLNHKTPLEISVPTVLPVAEEARKQGAILDLDKHSWPWSMMVVPIMKVDLFELSNNHIWRTEFAFSNWTIDTEPKYMNLKMSADGFSEWAWTEYGFRTYYALLNCGFRMRPTGGTASGVHPVPLGFGRVYVELEDGFDYDSWMDGLNRGRSFVTTGPMLFLKFNSQPPGNTFDVKTTASPVCHITGTVESAHKLNRIEVIVNGEIVKTILPGNQKTISGGYRSVVNDAVSFEGSGWVAVRCFEDVSNSRYRFAHSSPVHFDVPGHLVRPRKVEVEYFIGRMKKELARNRGMLRPDAIAEYERALKIYQDISKLAR